MTANRKVSHFELEPASGATDTTVSINHYAQTMQASTADFLEETAKLIRFLEDKGNPFLNDLLSLDTKEYRPKYELQCKHFGRCNEELYSHLRIRVQKPASHNC